MDVATDPGICQNKVVNIEFPNGRIGFVFTLQRPKDKGVVVISFFGNGKNQLQKQCKRSLQH